ncbi:putative Ig domain-containing protein, partial [Candidatus Omnitrophota bacterium]
TITVNHVNRVPLFDTIGDKTIDEGVLLTFTISASDPDEDTLTYSASNLPTGASFDASTKTFSWTPTYDQAGMYPNVYFEVTDGSLSDSEDITITVNDVNRAPLLDTIGDKVIDEDALLSFTVSATDPDGDSLTYSALNLPTGASFDAPTKTFTWTPTHEQVGTYPNVHFEVTDGSLVDSEDITITVYEVVILITSPVDGSYIRGNVDITGSAFIGSVQNGLQSYELYYAPLDNPTNTTLIISSTVPVQDGVLTSWDIASCLEGEYILTLKVFSIGGGEYSYSINVNIDNINDAPLFVSLLDKYAFISRLLEFQVVATDPDDPATPWGTLTYSAADLPPGASFDPVTQIFSWQSTEADKGIYTITFTVSDNENNVTQDITLTTVVIEEIQITTNGLNQLQPAIYKDKIVWYDWRNINYDIYMYDLSTGQETQITNDPNDQILPVIYEDKIVWFDYRNGNSDIYMYDLSTGQEIQITDDSSEQFSTDIHEDKIVGKDGRNGNNDIYIYDFSTGQETQITNDPNRQLNPAIYRDKIVWFDYRNGNSDIYMYDLSTGQEIQITDDSFSQNVPAIYGDKIAWHDDRNGNSDIYMARLIFAPQILSISPTVVLPDQIFTITGTDFGDAQGASYVEFANGVQAVIETWSDTQITCSAPYAALTGLIEVITNGGESDGINVTI